LNVRPLFGVLASHRTSTSSITRTTSKSTYWDCEPILAKPRPIIDRGRLFSLPLSISIRYPKSCLAANMARHTIKPGRQEREANQPQRRKSARISSAHEVFNRHVPKLASPVHRPVHRPVREAPNAKDVRNLKREKIRQTVSTAGMFKKKLKVNPHDEKHHRHREVREPTPEPDFVTDFRGTLLKY
jgi:hypothetical protein